MVNQWLIHGSILANQLEPIEAQLSLRAHGCDARQLGSSQFVPTVDMERKYGAHPQIWVPRHFRFSKSLQGPRMSAKDSRGH